MRDAYLFPVETVFLTHLSSPLMPAGHFWPSKCPTTMTVPLQQKDVALPYHSGISEIQQIAATKPNSNFRVSSWSHSRLQAFNTGHL
jgi:hypothetical protein